MISRIAGLVVATAAVLAAAAGPALAAPTDSTDSTPKVVKPFCAVALNQPCAWQQANSTGNGMVGTARIDAAGDQLTMLRVEVKIQRAWGSPWQTVASSTMIRNGSIQLSTPQVVTDYRTLVCATGGPAMDAEELTTICTN